jgi:hypothetical protein
MIAYHLETGAGTGIYTARLGLFAAATGIAVAGSQIGGVGDDTRIHGLEYCITDNTIIISGYSVFGDWLGQTN